MKSGRNSAPSIRYTEIEKVCVLYYCTLYDSLGCLLYPIVIIHAAHQKHNNNSFFERKIYHGPLQWSMQNRILLKKMGNLLTSIVYTYLFYPCIQITSKIGFIPVSYHFFTISLYLPLCYTSSHWTTHVTLKIAENLIEFRLINDSKKVLASKYTDTKPITSSKGRWARNAKHGTK